MSQPVFSCRNKSVELVRSIFPNVLNANRHWVAAGFLTSTGFFLLLMFLNWRGELRGFANPRVGNQRELHAAVIAELSAALSLWAPCTSCVVLPGGN